MLRPFLGREDEPPAEMHEFIARMEKLLAAQAKAAGIEDPGEIVYTLMPNWGRQRGHTWQVYHLMPGCATMRPAGHEALPGKQEER